jgi:glycine/D-amino acid oxidase-like deaminating enzyme
MKRIEVDVTVVGAGIAGLWCAKELADRGLKVAVVEKSATLANGATTKNEGWLHAGTYHSVAARDDEETKRMGSGALRGHDAIMRFAPEVVDCAQTYALAATDEYAERAVARWRLADVAFKDVRIDELGESIGRRGLRAAFAVADKSINTKLLCEKLAKYIQSKGSHIYMSAMFKPIGPREASITIGGRYHIITAQQFVLAAGVHTDQIAREVAGTALPMRYFKTHLLVTPRLARHNYFYLERGEAGFMNHNNMSVVGINWDSVEMDRIDYEPVAEKQALIHSVLRRLVPHTVDYYANAKALTVVCLKPDVILDPDETQNIDTRLVRISPTYLCVWPGKMTAAPNLAQRVADSLLGEIKVSGKAVKLEAAGDSLVCRATPRPLDTWRYNS